MKRCWEEARRLGAVLAASRHSGRDEIAAELRELDRDFELCISPEEEAVHALLDGLAGALEAGSGYPLNYSRGRHDDE